MFSAPEIVIPGKNLNWDRQGFKWKAGFDAPADWSNDLVLREAKRVAEWFVLDSYKDKGWVHYREPGDPAFWIKGGAFAPLENGSGSGGKFGKSVSTDNNYKMDGRSIAVRWGDIIPDLAMRRWFVEMRFHGKPRLFTRLVRDPNEPVERTLITEEDGVW